MDIAGLKAAEASEVIHERLLHVIQAPDKRFSGAWAFEEITFLR